MGFIVVTGFRVENYTSVMSLTSFHVSCQSVVRGGGGGGKGYVEEGVQPSGWNQVVA